MNKSFLKLGILGVPKVRMLGVLLLLSFVNLAFYQSVDLVSRWVFTTLTLLASEYIFWKIRGVTPFLPFSGLVTSQIIFLLADINTSYVLLFLASFLAAGIKQIARVENNHIFNPAAAGLLIASLLGLSVTWWGTSWGSLPLLIILFGAGKVTLLDVRQYLIVFSFIISSLILSFLQSGQPLPVLNQFVIGSFWFFTLIMLPEPITAAHYPKTKLFYGFFVAILTFLYAKFRLPIDSLLLPLLIGNLITRMFEKVSFLKNR